MKDTNYVEKYLTQKKFSALDVVLIIVCVAAVVWVIFLPNGLPIGVPVLFLAAVSLLFSQSRHIKDEHFDSILKQRLDENNIAVDDTNIIAAYDFDRSLIKKGKDGIIRTDKYVVTKVEFVGEEILLSVSIFCLVEDIVEVKKYNVSCGQNVVLSVNNKKTSVGVLEAAVLECDEFEESIPVSVSDYNVEKLVQRICNNNEKN
ncbi:MAG: hypothetical protein IIW63_05240 [Clostridia bacterium]|nr:hypothetical protein [Clostridia bacterium]